MSAGRRPLAVVCVSGGMDSAVAAALAARDLEEHAALQRRLRDRLHEAIQSDLPEGAVQLNGHPTERLPNTLNLGFRGLEAAALLDRPAGRFDQGLLVGDYECRGLGVRVHRPSRSRARP